LSGLKKIEQVRDMLGDGRLIKRRIVDGRGLNYNLSSWLHRSNTTSYLTKCNCTCFWDDLLSGEFPMDCPLHDSLLKVHYKGLLLNEEKTVFYDTRVDNNGDPLEFSSGEGLVSALHAYRLAAVFVLFLHSSCLLTAFVPVSCCFCAHVHIIWVTLSC
jgi:hypothetical protein